MWPAKDKPMGYLCAQNSKSRRDVENPGKPKSELDDSMKKGGVYQSAFPSQTAQITLEDNYIHPAGFSPKVIGV